MDTADVSTHQDNEVRIDSDLTMLLLEELDAVRAEEGRASTLAREVNALLREVLALQKNSPPGI